MKSIFTSIFVALISIQIQAQELYFQQALDYHIYVQLDTVENMLKGNWELEYTNNSPEALSQLYIHVYPNAFKHKQTSFAKQELKYGSADFYFANSSALGYIDSLDFHIDGKPVNWKLDPEYEDIAILFLQDPILPGAKTSMTTGFRVKIPGCFTNFCRTEKAYQIMNWYPKPAVYDQEGWHAMPNLTRGDFNEYASFHAVIDLPSSFQLVSTGVLKSKGKSPQKGFTRYEISADQVHDFAWVASEKLMREEKIISLKSGKEIKVETWYDEFQEVYWKNAFEYVEASLRYFSEQLGEYPYDEINLVQLTNDKASSWHFPMMLFIEEVKDSRALDYSIIHQIAHQWFNGILKSDNRIHAWMDEGLAVYYDIRCGYDKYGESHFSYFQPKFHKNGELNSFHARYLTQAQQKIDQAPTTAIPDLAVGNFQVSGYMKPAMAFHYLEKYVGRDAFDAAMRKYIEKWKFKHPRPKDLRNVLEGVLKRDLSWFFEDLIGSNKHMDYAIKKVEKEGINTVFIIQNKGDIMAPIKWYAYSQDSLISSAWEDGFDGEKRIVLEGLKYDWITLDAEVISPDVDRSNNHIRPKALFKKFRKSKYGWFTGFDDSRFDQRYLFPLLAFNKYDGLMLGISDHEPLLPGKPVEQEFITMGGLASKNLVGIYNLRSRHYFDDGFIKKLEWGWHARSFSYAKVQDSDQEFRYWTIKPHFELSFNRSPLSRNRHSIKYRLHLIGTDDEKLSEELSQRFYIHELSYSFRRKHVLTPVDLNLTLEHQTYKVLESSEDQENYLKLKAEAKLGYSFSPDQKLQLRLFSSLYLKNSKRESNSYTPPFSRGSTPLSYQGYNDYLYDEYFFGRSEQEGIWAQQVAVRDGGFKTVLGSAFSSFGQSNSFLTSVNIVSDIPASLPAKFPLKIYFDAGVFTTKSNASDPLESKFWYSGGLMLDFFEGFFSVYVPLLNASEINDLYSSIDAGFFRKISFSLDLKKLHPDRIREAEFY